MKEALNYIKKLPFSKSWQNTYVAKEKGIVDPETGKVTPQEFEVFVFIPAAKLIQHLGNDRAFLAFRNEHKFSDDLNFPLVADKTENNNRRLAVLYVKQFFKEAEINFLIDNAFTIYITEEELERLSASDNAEMKSFATTFYVPKTHIRKKGAQESFS